MHRSLRRQTYVAMGCVLRPKQNCRPFNSVSGKFLISLLFLSFFSFSNSLFPYNIEDVHEATHFHRLRYSFFFCFCLCQVSFNIVKSFLFFFYHLHFFFSKKKYYLGFLLSTPLSFDRGLAPSTAASSPQFFFLNLLNLRESFFFFFFRVSKSLKKRTLPSPPFKQTNTFRRTPLNTFHRLCWYGVNST